VDFALSLSLTILFGGTTVFQSALIAAITRDRGGREAISESLFGELRRAGAAVRASVLCPGWVDTPIVVNSLRDTPSPSGLTGSMADFPGVFPPSFIAERVLEGIKEDRFYILAAQDDFLDWMRMRHRRIEDGRNPPVPRSAVEPN